MPIINEPVGDYIIIRQILTTKSDKGTLYIPESAQEKPAAGLPRAEVIRVNKFSELVPGDIVKFLPQGLIPLEETDAKGEKVELLMVLATYVRAIEREVP